MEVKKEIKRCEPGKHDFKFVGIHWEPQGDEMVWAEYYVCQTCLFIDREVVNR